MKATIAIYLLLKASGAIERGTLYVWVYSPVALAWWLIIASILLIAYLNQRRPR